VSNPSTIEPPRRPGKRARTRQLLIETAATLVRERGFSNVSMEDVAAKAGVTRGSIYGNFRDRHDLFVAVAVYRMPRIVPAPVRGATLQQQMRAIGKAVACAARDNRHNTVYWAAYMQHVLSDQALRQRADTQGRELRKRLVREWAEAVPRRSLSMSLDRFVKIVGAMTSSMIMAHSMSPEDYDEKVIVAAFEALADGAAGRRARPRRSKEPSRA